MPVQYQPYTSMYVSQRSPEISKTLRDRFVQNFAAQNALQEKLSQLSAAPFEGDVEAKKQLDQKVNGTLSKLVERGDYENMTAPIMQIASQYNMESAPIMQNKQLYDQYKEGLKALYEEEKIDFEDYQGAIKLSTQQYNGISKNEDGSYGNYFSGKEAITNPDIPKRIKEALNGIVASEFGAESRILGQGKDGSLTVETKNGIEVVAPERVNSVLDAVFMDSQVQSYLNRKGQIRTLDMDEYALARTVQSAFPDQDLSSVDPDTMQSIASQMVSQNLEGQYRQSAISRYAYQKEETSEKYYWDKWWLQKQKDGAGATGEIGIGVAGAITEESLGLNTSQVNTSIENAQSTLNDLQNSDYLHKQFGLPEEIEYEDLFTMSMEDYTTAYGRDSGKIFSNARQAATEAVNTIMINNKLLRDAEVAVGLTPENMESKLMSKTKIAEPLTDLSNRFGISTKSAALITADLSIAANNKPSLLSSETYQDRLMRLINKYPEGSSEREYAMYIAEHLVKKEDFMTSAGGGSLNYSMVASRDQKILDKVLGSSYFALSNELDDMNNYLEEQTKRQHSIPLYDVAPGMDVSLANRVSTFVENTPPTNYQFVDPSTGMIGTLEEVIPSHIERGEVTEEFDVSSATISGKVLYSPYSFGMQGATMQVTLKDSEDQEAKLHVPISNLDVSTLEPYYASAPYQLSRAISSFYSAGYDEARIPILQPSGNKVYLNVNMVSPSGKIYHITDAQGNKIGESGDLDSSMNSGYLSNIFAEGARILPFE